MTLKIVHVANATCIPISEKEKNKQDEPILRM
jgi:hypothetical protein